MRRVVLAVTAAVVLAIVGGAAKAPHFVDWLQPSSPGDETIRVYWQRAAAGEASPSELMDLGTMLFVRGFSNDARTYFEQAEEALAAQPERTLDDEIMRAETWFRIGLVEHSQSHLDAARTAYHHCLKILKGHGRCNFYLGLLEEQTGHPKQALKYYRTAFRVAPELADPAVNPEVMYSNVGLGAKLRTGERERFASDLPLRYLEPNRVRSVLERFMPTPTPTPTPSPTPAATPLSASGAAGEAPSVPVLPRVHARPRVEEEPPPAQPEVTQDGRRERPRMPESLRERLEQMRLQRRNGGRTPLNRRPPGTEPQPTAAPTPTPG